MTSQWAGYLFKAIKDGQSQIFPSKYIAFDSWDSSPNQREYIKAYREDFSRTLYQIPAAGQMSTFSFKTRDNLHEKDVVAIYTFFENFEFDSINRKIKIEFWNNETHSYTQGIFYRPNPKFQIKRISNSDIVYKEQIIEFIQAEAV